MKKFFFKYTIIILANLLAFLILGHILDVIFSGGAKYKTIMLIVSIVPLIYFSSLMIKQTLENLENISKDT